MWGRKENRKPRKKRSSFDTVLRGIAKKKRKRREERKKEIKKKQQPIKNLVRSLNDWYQIVNNTTVKIQRYIARNSGFGGRG